MFMSLTQMKPMIKRLSLFTVMNNSSTVAVKKITWYYTEGNNA